MMIKSTYWEVSMCDRGSPYEPIGYREERKKRMRAVLTRMERGEYVSPDEKPNPYDLRDMELLTEIAREDQRT